MAGVEVLTIQEEDTLGKDSVAGPTSNGKQTDENVVLRPEKQAGGTIQATGGDRFIVVMTVQSGKAPKIEVQGTEFNPQIQVGNQTIDLREGTIILKSLKEGAD